MYFLHHRSCNQPLEIAAAYRRNVLQSPLFPLRPGIHPRASRSILIVLVNVAAGLPLPLFCTFFSSSKPGKGVSLCHMTQESPFPYFPIPVFLLFGYTLQRAKAWRFQRHVRLPLRRGKSGQEVGFKLAKRSCINSRAQ